MKLVIAEKPSVAMSLAAVLGATERKDGYLEGSGYLVSWCVGHLLELAQPEAYKEQYAKWRYEDLPILPENWKYEVPKDKKTQLALLCRLMKDKRVDSVVCATDAGREGELIFRLVYEYAGCKKPMERLWISSMEDAAIREGFDHLHPGSDYDKLYDAAVCRAGADWLIGINATRLFSVLYGVTLNVGRVMSPTLALLVQRESDIESFISKPFYVPEITCGGFTASGEKMTERSEAEKIRMDCDHNSAFVRSVEKQVKTIQPPRLYDLTTLQRECKEDFDLDKELISKLAVSERSEDKQLLWMSRPCGTYTLREREVYLEGSHENKVWRFYQEQTNDPVLAYAISLKEVRDGKIFGDLYPLNYREHVERMKKLTCPIGNVAVAFEDGNVITIPYQERRQFMNRLMPEHGAPKTMTYLPENEPELMIILKRERLKRSYHATAGNLEEYLDKLEKTTLREKLKRAKTAVSTQEVSSHKRGLER